MSVSASIKVETRVRSTSDILGTYTGSSAISYKQNLRVTDVSKCYAAARTATVSDTINVTSLTDAYGSALSFSTVKLVHIQNTDAANSITLTGNLIGSDSVTIGPGKCFYLDSGWAVDGTHDVLTVTPSSGSVPYNIILVGN